MFFAQKIYSTMYAHSQMVLMVKDYLLTAKVLQQKKKMMTLKNILSKYFKWYIWYLLECKNSLNINVMKT